MNNFIAIPLLVLCMASTAVANVTLPSIIGDNMVLQQKTASAIWGKAEPGEKVSVEGSWKGAQAQSAVADAKGNWMVKIKTPSAGGPFSLAIIGDNMIELKNVMSGEVWFSGGQSNMDMPLLGYGDDQPVTGGTEAIANADHPDIRLFNVEPLKAAKEPQFTCPGEWQPCSPETVGMFSAIAYIFGKEIHKHTDVPVGLIHSCVGGTYLETWMKPEVIENDPEFKKIISGFDQYKEDWISKNPEYKDKPDAELPFQFQDFERTGRLYNGMIAPLIPFTIKGAIWYQGESNGGRGHQYQRLFPAMITSWREEWNQGDFPFYFVQLANFIEHKPTEEVKYEKPAMPQPHGWAELRNAQLLTLSVTNTGMAVTIDIGEANNIHPANKIDIGKRLSLWALAKDYGKKDLVYSGPLYKSMKVESDKIHVSFDHTDGGLVAKGGKLEGFAIAGADEKFVWADAVIDGNTVIISNAEIKEPVAVRYAWELFPLCNLYNGADLPASPFRTDDWKLPSAGKAF
ncbi:MAG: sialate O-acetylesterase [Verrucomicrobia bacterium]|nr:MAG: sialate O-acetylesterase [Verrucomicrobiota bacterium]